MFNLQILSITAIVLANLCVAYIMTSQNEDAEDLMRKIEKEEERIGFQVFFFSPLLSINNIFL